IYVLSFPTRRSSDLRRLVEHDIPFRYVELHGLAVDVDEIDIGVDARAELRDDGSVHPHAAGDDEVLRRAPRRDAGGTERLLQARSEEHTSELQSRFD